MPIYLCQPGASSKEPWRHGVQVYERPFPLFNDTATAAAANDDGRANAKTEDGEGGKETANGVKQIVLAIEDPSAKYRALHRIVTAVIPATDAANNSTANNKQILIFCTGSNDNDNSNNNNDSGGETQYQSPVEEWARASGFAASSLHPGQSPSLREFKLREFVAGKVKILVVDQGVAEAEVVAKLTNTNTNNNTPSSPLKIHTVINYDLRSLPVETYVARLQYASHAVISFFHAKEDAPLAKELVAVLQRYNQEVPRGLLACVPPALMTPPFDRSRNNATEGNANDNDNAMESNDNDGEGGRATGMVAPRGDTNLNLNNAAIEERRRRLQRQFRENHDTTVSHSSDDDSQGGSQGGGGGRGNNNGSNNNNDSSGSLVAETLSSGRRTFFRQNSTAGSDAHGANVENANAFIAPNPVRRVRHAEVVLVDRCLVAYGRTWLRLRWPGEQGGFGGFVALSRADDAERGGGRGVRSGYYRAAAAEDPEGSGGESGGESGSGDVNSAEGGMENLCQEIGTGAAPPSFTQTSLLCKETNVHYPTSVAMKLLPLYDDGLCTPVKDAGKEIDETPENGEPVFCRICREGVHDVNYDFDKPATDNNAATTEGDDSGRSSASAAAGEAAARRGDDSSVDSSVVTTHRVGNFAEASDADNMAALSHLPPIVLHHPTAENPLLAPCKCTGTMAFVHYLCIEQWRCRSRHPNARNGLNCETCGAEYTLPPPPSRPASRHDLMGGGAMGNGVGPNGNLMAEDDWLDAMPPHVLAALRRPHPAWQLGAAVVRRRWLRPVVPVLVSPLVALYCRARRTLKKRGVSRRRWACSLCRRRARWKCVRCLRSYYCSRQCQNVSWHIVHKHVCYKPVRFWWSVVVYTLGLFLAVPKLVENFPIYDAMVTLLPVNFIALGIIGGGIASALKRSSGVDIRGRILEIIVVFLTMSLTGISSGLVRGYFGNVSQCWGVFASLQSSMKGEVISGDSIDAATISNGPFYPSILNTVLLEVPLRQIQLWYLKWDFILSKLGFLSRRFLCVPTEDGNTDYSAVGCSPSTRNINPQFYLEEDGGAQCSGDMALVMGVWFMALGVLVMGHVYRQVRGAMRRNNNAAAGGVAAHRGRRRPHQD